MIRKAFGTLRWINVFSLDAVAVAVAWQVALTKLHTGQLPSINQHIVMAMVVWLVYTADRWLDGLTFRHRPTDRPSHRHQFYRRHRRGSALAWVSVLAIFLVAALATLDYRDAMLCVPAALIIMVYLWCRTCCRQPRSPRLKSLIVGALFSYGMHILTLRRYVFDPSEMTFESIQILVLSWGLLTSLVRVNCRGVDGLKRRVDRSYLMGQPEVFYCLIGISLLFSIPSNLRSTRLAWAGLLGIVLMLLLHFVLRKRDAKLFASTRSVCSSGYDLCLLIAALTL